MMMTTTNSKVNSAAAKHFITVATKTHDGGAKAISTYNSQPAAKRPREPVRKHEDPFMYYSHQETRMRTLLFQDEDDYLHLQNEPDVNSEPVVRKTRISFELHPALLLDDLFLDNHHLVAEEDNDDVDMIEYAYYIEVLGDVE